MGSRAGIRWRGTDARRREGTTHETSAGAACPTALAKKLDQKLQHEADTHTPTQGAAFTFDLPAYSAFIDALRIPLLPTPPPAIPFPTFDHKLKDPRLSPVPVTAHHRIVIVEGLYTLLSEPGWCECAAQMDMRVWVEVPRDVVLRRVLKRNMQAGIVTDPETARLRVDQSDMANGDDVYAHRYLPTDTIYPEDHPQY